MRSRTRSRRTAAHKQVEGGIGVLRDRGQGAVGTAVETLGPRLESAREALAPHIETAREALAPKLETARDAAGQALTDAGEWAAPRLDAAREQAVATVREKVAPKVGKAIATAAEASKPARKEAKNRTDAALAALRGEVGPPKKRRRSHRLSFLLGAGAVTGAVVALVVRRREPTYPTFEPITPMSGPDPYAKPTNTQPPAAPISSLNDEIAGNLNPAAVEATSTTETTDATSTDPTHTPSNGEATTTIDVTGEPVDLSTTDETAETGGRHRKRTRRGEQE